jgi:hypothetical protein
MWNFHYLLLLTKRPAQWFCQDPKFQAILARPKYQQGGHGKITDEDVAAGQCDGLATPAFLELFMKKVERLETAGEKTQWKKGNSVGVDTQFKVGKRGNVDTQFKAGESGNVDTQFKAGKSGNVDTQFKTGDSRSKATQWVSCGRFGVKGKEETYASMNALAKAIGRDRSNLSKALTRAKQETPSHALRVDFKYARLELFWDKESGVGESAVEEEEEEEAP